jgi:hypothetical protein
LRRSGASAAARAVEKKAGTAPKSEIPKDSENSFAAELIVISILFPKNWSRKKSKKI